MAQLCVIDGCKYTSRVLCHCCNKDLCLEHLKQHNELINAQLNALADDINTLIAQLITLNIEDMALNHREKLDQWRKNSFMIINQLYEKKCEEIEKLCFNKFDLIQYEIEQIRSKISKLINEQEINVEELKILKLSIYDEKIIQCSSGSNANIRRHLINVHSVTEVKLNDDPEKHDKQFDVHRKAILDEAAINCIVIDSRPFGDFRKTGTFEQPSFYSILSKISICLRSG
ncbi:unnamed protein product [Adineta steineri]|uniref:Uncharacterized protein n=1 Tax=Adineta steineri TaxID=433720 RepID=A0A819R3R6_9BILA|nr:unnamed protein product [Adineta steineri]CAF4038332.1 unnamed protein product [Adineta steineri]